MRRIVVVLALLIGASSCSSCDSCKGSSAKPDGGGDGATSVIDTATPVASSAPAPSASAGPMEPNYACRMVARAITTKACECPQKNKMGCCYFGAPGNGAEARAPYANCSGGKTDWPAEIEEHLCKMGTEERLKELLFACYAARNNLRCGRSEGGDVGAEVPRECETLLKEVQTSLPKKPK
jgi:hypothetical protein